MTRLVVVDTNVVVAALLTAQRDSPTARTLNAMLDGTLMHVLSPDLLAEYRAVLARPRLAQRHGLSEAELDELLATITANAVWRVPPAAFAPATEETPLPAAPDDSDAHLWALLACEPAAWLVTGDQLLLQRPYPGRWLMQPGQLWSVLDWNPGD
jgi:putative PIN family toxin of toxin-antitoxin system